MNSLLRKIKSRQYFNFTYNFSTKQDNQNLKKTQQISSISLTKFTQTIWSPLDRYKFKYYCNQSIESSLRTEMIKYKQTSYPKRHSNEKTNATHGNNHKKEKEKNSQTITCAKSRGNSLKNDKSTQFITQQQAKIVSNLRNSRKSLKRTLADSNQIIMKKDLKMLLTKNTLGKSKLSTVAPDLLKKIEENCKILRKIDSSDQGQSQKKTNKQNSKQSKSFKLSGCNNKSEVVSSKSIHKIKEGPLQPKGTLKNNRYSYQISKQDKNQLAKNIRPCIRQQKSSQEMDLIDAFKEYKHQFENEDLKVEKSSKNTNYNTAQSRNSSSLLNSHGFSNIIDTITKQQKHQDNFNRLEKVQSIIKHQKNLMEKNKEHKRSVEMEISQTPVFQLSSNSKAIKEVKNKVLNLKELQPDDLFIKSGNQKAQVIGNAEGKLDKVTETVHHGSSAQQFQKVSSFQKSKYYVQPIPPFKRYFEEQNEIEDSLAGCEITLIENNIIDDSELPELEL